jgi:hypothetical protein
MLPAKDTLRGYGTWLPAMFDAMLRTTGPVLEIGGGHGTGILHAYCDGLRKLTTVEFDPNWRAQLEVFGSEWHAVLAEIPPEEFDVALVDSAPATTRQPIIQQLTGRVKHIVVHDVDDPGYGYDFSRFRHIAMWNDLRPWTAVLTE